MLKIIRHDTYSKNETKTHGDGLPCIYCGKHVNKPRYYVHLFDGLGVVTEDEAQHIIATDGYESDLGAYPIGADCLKKHPEIKPYVIKE